MNPAKGWGLQQLPSLSLIPPAAGIAAPSGNLTDTWSCSGTDTGTDLE